MTKHYKTYIEPILNAIGPDALANLEKNALLKSFITTIRSPKFMFLTKEHREVFIRNAYWSIIKLYSLTRFMYPTDGFGNKCFTPKDKQKYTKIYEKLDNQTGKLNIPKRYHSIFTIVQDPAKGYICRMHRTDKYPFYVVTKPENRTAVYNALRKLSAIPLRNIDDSLELWKFVLANSQLKSTAPKQSKKNGHGHLAVAEEIWNEMNTKGRFEKIQEQINNVKTNAKRLEKIETRTLVSVRREQAQAIIQAQNLWNNNSDDDMTFMSAKHVMDTTAKCQQSLSNIQVIRDGMEQQIETVKVLSGLPFQKLRKTR